MTDVDDRARHLISQQHGLLTSAQAHGLGLTSRAIAHRVERGQLRWLTRRVLALTGCPTTMLQTLLAAVLDAGPGAALSHTSALAHWGVRGFLASPVHIVRHRERIDHPARGSTVHELRFLPRDEVRTLESVPVVSPALALLQIAGMRSIGNGRLARAVDAAWADRLVTYSTLTAVHRLMSRQGRGGLVRFRELVEERGPGYVPPASNLEARFTEILARAGRTPMRRQVDCSGEAGWIGRVDFKDLDLPLVVEVQSERFHIGLSVERADIERVERLEGSGLEVLEVTDIDIFQRPAEVLSAVDEARVRARNRLAA